jgi:DNA-binding FrmR family transcriptional regulator
VKFEADSAADSIRRLRRIEGQVAGIIRMIEEGRECRDVVQQVAAVSKAVDRVGYKLLTGQMRYCLQHEDEARAEGYDPETLEKMFLALS